MDTILNIILQLVIASCVISVLFILTRIYFCYFAKPKQIEAQKDARVEEMYCGKAEAAESPAKKTAKKKAATKKTATRKKKTEQ